jgi:uncharacterized protein (TIGR02611 family)
MNAESHGRREASGRSPADGAQDASAAAGATAAGATAIGGRLGSRAPEFIQASRPLHVSWQVGVFLVGLAVVGAGLLILPLPGPGWLVIFAGVAVWASEFVWAQLVLRWTKRKATEVTQKALDPRVRRRNIVLAVTGFLIIVAALAVYLRAYGFVMPWKVGRQG